MKVTTRSNSTPRKHPRTSYEMKVVEDSYKSLKNQAVSLSEVNNGHYSRRGTCPVVFLGGNNQRQTNQEQYNNSYKTTSQGVADSRKDMQFKNMRQNWKIMTLQEIRSKREPRIVTGESSSSVRTKSKQKIFVSIAKSNRSSRQKAPSEPKLLEIKGSHTLLNSLSNRGRIVETVELQLQEDKSSRNYFLC